MDKCEPTKRRPSTSGRLRITGYYVTKDRRLNVRFLLFVRQARPSDSLFYFLLSLSIAPNAAHYKYSLSSIPPPRLYIPLLATTMARPHSHPAISLSYDPYSYYSVAYSKHDSFIHLSTDTPRTSTYRRQRPASIWSTSSICSEDSSLDLALDDREHDFDDDESVASPISPAESSSSRTSWSSMASSSSSTSRSSATQRDRSERYKRSTSSKPRGPRPLPALPTSQPPSPYSTTSSLPPTLQVKVTPPLRLNLKVLTPPPSYEEAMSAGVHPPSSEPSLGSRYEQPAGLSGLFPHDPETEVDAVPIEFLTSPHEETVIDWQRIEEFMARCDG